MTDDFDPAHLARLLARVAEAVDSDQLGVLLDECNAVIVTVLARDREHVAPPPPTRTEIARFAKLVMQATTRERSPVLREIRRALGRLDAHAVH